MNGRCRYATQFSSNKEKTRAPFTTIADQWGAVVGDGSDGGAQTGLLRRVTHGLEADAWGKQMKDERKDHTNRQARNMNEGGVARQPDSSSGDLLCVLPTTRVESPGRDSRCLRERSGTSHRGFFPSRQLWRTTG
jgi:hypothetical protein